MVRCQACCLYFNKLYGAGGVVLRSNVEERLALIRYDKGNDDDDGHNDRGIRNNLRRLINVMGDKETIVGRGDQA